MYEQYKNPMLAWIKEAEDKSVSDIDFLDIVSELLPKNLSRMRFNLLKEMMNKGITYTPTENGRCKTTDVVFHPDEVRVFLDILQRYHTTLTYKCLYPQKEEAEEIKKYHNDLIDNLEMGGCWDEKPGYIE
jgi:hypothetical protein